VIRVLTLALLLGGCTASASVGPVTRLEDLTAADLKAAIVIARAAVPPDEEAIVCFTFLDTNLAALTVPPPPVAGAVSAFELAHVGVNAALGFSPIGNVALEQACGPYALNVMGGIAALLGRFGINAGVTVGL
jgi:hypothetical protein